MSNRLVRPDATYPEVLAALDDADKVALMLGQSAKLQRIRDAVGCPNADFETLLTRIKGLVSLEGRAPYASAEHATMCMCHPGRPMAGCPNQRCQS